METALVLQQLTDRLAQVESEVRQIRNELAHLNPPHPARSRGVAFAWTDKAAQKRRMKEVFEALGIQGAPIGVQALRVEMARAGLAPNELSRGIIDAREE